MKKVKIYISIITLILIIFMILIYPQHIEEASKAFVYILECEECLPE